ncbi:MAG: hypothetical protein WBV82_17615 [Myxococcaceae bacterium]
MSILPRPREILALFAWAVSYLYPLIAIATSNVHCTMGGSEGEAYFAFLAPVFVVLAWCLLRAASAPALWWVAAMHVLACFEMISAIRDAFVRSTLQGFSLCHRDDPAEYLASMGGEPAAISDRLYAPLLVTGYAVLLGLALQERATSGRTHAQASVGAQLAGVLLLAAVGSGLWAAFTSPA